MSKVSQWWAIRVFAVSDAWPVLQVELIGVGGAWEGKSNLAHSKLDHEYRWLKCVCTPFRMPGAVTRMHDYIESLKYPDVVTSRLSAELTSTDAGPELFRAHDDPHQAFNM